MNSEMIKFLIAARGSERVTTEPYVIRQSGRTFQLTKGIRALRPDKPDTRDFRAVRCEITRSSA
jgi:hypothetical protein